VDNKISAFLKKHGIPESQEINGSLYLSSLTSIPEGFNPTVGGYLDLSSLTSIPEGFNPTVGGSLYLSSLTSIPEGFNPTVGGSLYLSSALKRKVKVNHPSTPVRVFQQGEKGKGWIYADDILTHITNIEHKIGEYTFIKGKIPGMNLITDGTNWAHCDTVKNGVIDLRFKAADRDKSAYEDLTLDSKVSYEDAVIMYRVITGACRPGTQAFLNTLAEVKDEYTVGEIVDITNGQYNSGLFSAFFKKGETK
jgi:hypothetical protein